MLEHGGRVRQAAKQYGIPLSHWLDLSTGINPDGWPVPPVPREVWSRLPEDDDDLQVAAQAYYGAECLLPVAGSQAAIQALPQLFAAGLSQSNRRPASRDISTSLCVDRSRHPASRDISTSLCVAVVAPGYAEHAHAWKQYGHSVVPVAPTQIDEHLSDIDVLVLIHPNNPTGIRFTRAQLLEWHSRLAARGGWLVVDEAFMDATPEDSLAPQCPRPGLIVLRSLGKFFGLAGARVGFVLAEPEILNALRRQLGPWAVAAPSRWIAYRALIDTAWQHTARANLQGAAARLNDRLAAFGLPPSGGCALFQWVPDANASQIHQALAQRGILTRLFEYPASLRFGLPGDDAAWKRLDSALSEIMG